MKIAFFFEIFYPEINGVITSTENLALNLIEMGHEVLFVAPRTKKFSETLIKGRIRVYYLNSIPSALYPGLRLSPPVDIKLRHKLSREHIDIVHITGPFTVGLYGMNFARRYKIPIVHTFHTMITEYSYLRYLLKINSLIKLGSKMVIGYLRPYIRGSNVITAPSEYVKKFLNENFPGAKVFRISNGMSIDEFRNYDTFENLRKSYPRYNRKSFVFVGRLGHEKSVDILLKAFEKAVAQDNEIKLFIIGSGPEEEMLRRLASDSSLGDNVFFLGRVPHNEILQSGILHYARGFVTASKTEVQPMTVIEAILSGIPIVIPEVDGIMELFDGNGKTFEADNASELARCIVELANDDDMYEECRGRSVKMIPLFDGREVAGKFEQLYHSQINEMAGKRKHR